ncbi:MAG: type I restriction enzyme endonuclease domain-containing protein, partial [Cumulibacter sp.]
MRRACIGDRLRFAIGRRALPQQTAEVIAELVELAQDVTAEASRGSQFSPPLSGDELAFYDAVATNESAIDVQGEDVLAQIARDL